MKLQDTGTASEIVGIQVGGLLKTQQNQGSQLRLSVHTDLILVHTFWADKPYHGYQAHTLLITFMQLHCDLSTAISSGHMPLLDHYLHKPLDNY